MNIYILEWGCGPGRIIRHLKDTIKHNIKLYGSDFNAEAIEWCRTHIEDIEFCVNSDRPPFPFESNFFDCIYAISVFTHLSETAHFEWIKELLRVLKPHGLIIITTHGDSTGGRLLTHERRLYDLGKLIVRGHVKEGKKWYLAYHPPEFVKNELLKECEIISHGQFGHGYQDMWVARKRR